MRVTDIGSKYLSASGDRGGQPPTVVSCLDQTRPSCHTQEPLQTLLGIDISRISREQAVENEGIEAGAAREKTCLDRKR